jgi:ubiquinone/menaquinone biosynthesis C-methylase UbiE
MSASPSFDRVARIYRWAEYLTLGPLLQRTRTHFLPRLTQSKQALVLGDGDGRFLSKLLAQNQNLHATAIDTSEQMLNLLRSRCDPTRLETIHDDALSHTPAPTTDLIVTHFFLDCLTQEQVNALALHVAHAVQPGSYWLLSDFHVPKHRFLQPIARAYIRSLYSVFRILTNLRVTQLPNPAAALTAAGFHLIARHQTLGGILYAELWQRDGLQSDLVRNTER